MVEAETNTFNLVFFCVKIFEFIQPVVNVFCHICSCYFFLVSQENTGVCVYPSSRPSAAIVKLGAWLNVVTNHKCV